MLSALKRLFTRSAPPDSALPFPKRWPAVPASPNQTWVNDPVSRSKAEAEVRNGALARKIASAWSGAVIGGSGINPMFRDTGLRRRWDAWSRSCGADGRSDWLSLQQQIVECLVVSGECFCVLQVDEYANEVPLSILVLGPEFIDTSHDDARTTTQGIRFSGTRRTGYWMFRSHPGEPGTNYGESVLLDARDVLHIYRPPRPGATRGESWLNPVFGLLQQLRDYTAADLVRAKVQSLFAGFTISDTGASPLAGNNALSLEPGAICNLPPGTSGIEFTNPTDHGTAFDPFVKSVLRQIAAGVNLPYEIFSDLSQITFASGRAGLLEWRRQVESVQYGLLVPQLCEPVLQRWLQLSEALGYADGSTPHPRWAAPTLEALDRRAEIQSTVLAIRSGSQSRREAVESLGWVIEDLDAELANDQARADRFGLVLDSSAKQRTQQGQAQFEEQEQEQ